MFSALIEFALSHLLYFALHVERSGSFPKPLSAAEEAECFEKMAHGSVVARNMLIEHNLRLVAHIAKKYYAASGDQEDFISIGTIGLIKAVNTFNGKKGTRFATYAARCIENEMRMHLRSVKKTAGDVYLGDPVDVDKDGNTLTLSDVMADEENLMDAVDCKLKTEQLYRLMDEYLTPREQEILQLRYGLHGTRPLTQREVAAKLNISRSYVSRLEKRALLTLREQFAEA